MAKDASKAIPEKEARKRRRFTILEDLRLGVDCPDCGARRGYECKPDYGCDDLTRCEEALISAGFAKRI